MKKLIFLFGIALFTANCAGFKNSSESGYFNKNNLEEIDGTYKNNLCYKKDSCKGNLAEIFDRETNMFAFLQGRQDKYDDKKDLKLTLKLIDKKRLNVKINDSEGLLFDKNLKVKLKNNGFLYLKEKRLMIEGIPFVAGGWNFQKSRFTMDENHNLQVHLNYFFYAAFLTIIGDSKTTHSHFTFERL